MDDEAPEVIRFASLNNIVETCDAQSSTRNDPITQHARGKISEARVADALRHLSLDDSIMLDYELVDEHTIHLTLEADTVSQLDTAYKVVSGVCWSQVLDHTIVITKHPYEGDVLDKILDMETDAQLSIDEHGITISCPNVQDMWQALAEMNCIAKGNGILHKVNVNAITGLMRREGGVVEEGCLSCVHRSSHSIR